MGGGEEEEINDYNGQQFEYIRVRDDDVGQLYVRNFYGRLCNRRQRYFGAGARKSCPWGYGSGRRIDKNTLNYGR